MSENFHVWNPSYLGRAISTIPIPLQAKFGAERSSGPVLDMCYVLFNIKEEQEEKAVENPTKNNHAGWDMIGEGIFKGWEKPPKAEGSVRSDGTMNLDFDFQRQRREWRPILHAREYPNNRILNSPEERNLIKFNRVYRSRYRQNDPDMYSHATSTNKIANYLCWIECEYYTHPVTTKQGNAKLKMLSKTRGDGEQKVGKLNKLPKVLQSKILSTNLTKNVTQPRPTTPDILLNRGGKRKTRRKTRRKKRKNTKKKYRRKKDTKKKKKKNKMHH